MAKASALLPLMAVSLVAMLAGCDSSSSYFPLDIGSTATFRIRGFRKDTTIIRVKRIISVAGVRGYELQCPNGASRVAWKNGVLVADELAGARLNPPLPLLDPNQTAEDLHWEGTLGFLESNEHATGTLSQSVGSELFSGRKVRVIKTSLTVDTPKRQIELESEYAAGIGLIKQQQRTNGQFDIELTRL